MEIEPRHREHLGRNDLRMLRLMLFVTGPASETFQLVTIGESDL